MRADAQDTALPFFLPSSASPIDPAWTGLLDEHQSLLVIEKYGVPVVKHLHCRNPEEAEAAFDQLGGSVVVKGCAGSIPHKSEYGLVHVNLRDAGAVKNAATECLGKLDQLTADHAGVIVAEMVKGRHEFVLGVTVDPLLGALVMIGDGGTLVELRRDVVTLLVPFDEAAAIAALRRLRIAPLFDGYRDQHALDIAALARAAVALGNFACAAGHRLRSVDLNPMMVMACGQGVIAVDAVVELESAL